MIYRKITQFFLKSNIFVANIPKIVTKKIVYCKEYQIFTFFNTLYKTFAPHEQQVTPDKTRIFSAILRKNS